MSSSGHLSPEERVKMAVSVGESHFREFKSAVQGRARTAKRDAKSICRDVAEVLVAFANADGGMLLLGVEDNGTVTGVPHTEDDIERFLRAYRENVHHDTPLPQPRQSRVVVDGKQVLIFEIGKSAEIHQTSDGRCLQRHDLEQRPVSSRSISVERRELISREYDRQFVDGASLKSLDPDLLRLFGDAAQQKMSAERLLQFFDLAEVSDLTTLRLRRAAVLLFGFEKDIRRWHPTPGVIIYRVAGFELGSGVDYNVGRRDEVVGPIFTLIEAAWGKLRDCLAGERPAALDSRLQYPEQACREALTNAIVHRDYSIEGRSVEVFVYDDRVSVKSPGCLLSTVPIAELRRFDGLHQTRNIMIMRILREAGQVFEMGEGLRRISSAMRERNLQQPDLESTGETFEITLYRRPIFSDEDAQWLRDYEDFNLTPREERVIVHGRSKELFSRRQIEDWTEIRTSDDFRDLVEPLVLKGILVPIEGSQVVQNVARARGLERRDLPRYRIRTASECRHDLEGLLRELAKRGKDAMRIPQVMDGVGMSLPSNNYFRRRSAQLGKALFLLGLQDGQRRPTAKLLARLK